MNMQYVCAHHLNGNFVGRHTRAHTNIYLSFKVTMRQAFATKRKRKRDHGPIVTMAPKKKPLKQLLNGKSNTHEHVYVYVYACIIKFERSILLSLFVRMSIERIHILVVFARA